MFDTVDNVYGEPGAEYSDDAGGNEQGDMDGAPSGGGGMPMGGDLDFGDGDEDMGEETGAEGEMDMNMAAQENGVGPDMGGNEQENMPPPNLADSLLRNMNKKVLTEKKRIEKEILERSEHYADILEERLLKYNSEKSKNQEKIDIYDKAFFLNEEMNDLKTQLERIDEKLSSTEE